MGEQAVNSCDWRHDHKFIKDKIEHVLRTSELTDCEFIVGTKPYKEVFKGHKFVLALSSPVFEAMFYGDLAEQGQVSIPDMQPQVFRKILKYIYKNTIKLQTFEEALSVYYGAKKYLLFHLVEDCVNYLKKILSSQTVCKIYEFAKYVEEQKLKERCEKVIIESTGSVVSADAFKEATLDTVIDILKLENIYVSSELELFNALQKWIEHNGKESRSNGLTVRDALNHIRFLSMTPSEFARGPANSDLLTKDEKLIIFKNICTEDFNKYPMPNGLSQNHQRRKYEYGYGY